MSIRKAQAHWSGTLKEGKGELSVESGAFKGAYSFSSRFESGTGTNPEELVGAAHAGCYSMFLSALLSENQLKPVSIDTTAEVKLERDDVGPKITSIHLECRAEVDGISATDFQALAQKAKQNCPISRLFSGTDITLTASLV